MQNHLTLSQLQKLVKATLDEAFALPVWVSAEIAEIKINYSGHCYLELVEKGGDNGVPLSQARAVIWRTAYARIAGYFEAETGQRLAAGIRILARVMISYHELYGFSLNILDIDPTFTLGDIVHVISHARRNIFPVIDDFGRLIGVVQLDDLREDMFKREKYGHPISDYMIQPPDKILEHEAIQSVVQKFEDKHTWMLPVVDKQNRYMGFISKSRILNAYREQLVKIQQ